MGYYATIKRNEIMPLAAIWMNLEDIINKSNGEKYSIISLIYEKIIQINICTK